MPKQAKYIIIIVVVALLLTFGLSLLNNNTIPSGPGQYDDLAVCLQDKGVKFYGAFWCPHCQEQKKIFGASAKLLPYVECSTPDTTGQLQVCKDAKIESYPTWIFPDGSRSGGLTPAELAEKASCVLENITASSTPIDTGTSAASSTVK